MSVYSRSPSPATTTRNVIFRLSGARAIDSAWWSSVTVSSGAPSISTCPSASTSRANGLSAP